MFGIKIMQGDCTESEGYVRKYVATELKQLVPWH